MGKADHDLVIIGGGPAGLTAGLYASRARMNVVLIEKIVPGGQIMVTDWVENYPGFPEGITGADLAQRMAEQAQRFDLPVEYNEVISLDFSGPLKKIQLSDRVITTHAIIIASGASPKQLGIPGEQKFYGKGVSFCGTCDAPFYKDKVVAAVGGGDTAVQESQYLTKFARKVYLIHRRDELRATKILQERAFANEKIDLVWDSVPTAIEGTKDVQQVRVKNIRSGEESVLDVDGCFVWIGTSPNTAFVKDTVRCDEYGFIEADGHMQTSEPGVYAAGDVRTTPLRQIVTAVGDAAIAVASAEHYIENVTS
jgi:thioredoxin reductase (NADPH)